MEDAKTVTRWNHNDSSNDTSQLYDAEYERKRQYAYSMENEDGMSEKRTKTSSHYENSESHSKNDPTEENAKVEPVRLSSTIEKKDGILEVVNEAESKISDVKSKREKERKVALETEQHWTKVNHSQRDNEAKKESSEAEFDDPSTIDVRTLFSHLQPLPTETEKPLTALSPSELQELESVLEFSNNNSQSESESGWRNDWSGNLAYIDKEIRNPLFRVKNLKNKPSKGGGGNGGGSRGKKANEKLNILQWAMLIEDNGAAVAKSNAVRRLVKSLLRHVCTYTPAIGESSTRNNGFETISNEQALQPVPASVFKLFSSLAIETSPLSDIEDAIRRASYDPQILQEDGWIVEKSNDEQGATGGPYRIGDKIRYENSDAVVIAYTHDNDIGDLWKALWTEDYITFDLEAEELWLAKQKWERVHLKKPHEQKAVSSTTAVRRKAPPRETTVPFSTYTDFTVKGIEYGIVLASSYAKGARPGVYWPARVLHVSETPINGKRNSSKTYKRLDLVFLAPYWNAADDLSYTAGKTKVGTSLSDNVESVFNSNPLFQFETVDVTDEVIKPYPFGDDDDDSDSHLDVSQLQMSFRFTGLPKSAFPRFLDAYRLASCLREYAKCHIEIIKPSAESAASLRATAALFDAHPIAVQVPLFQPVILHLPFSYILSQLPKLQKSSDTPGGIFENGTSKEPILQLHAIINAMKPPYCWGIDSDNTVVPKNGQNGRSIKKNVTSTVSTSGDWLQGVDKDVDPDHNAVLHRFVTEFPLLNETFDRFNSFPTIAGMLSCLHRLLQVEESEDATETLPIQEQLSMKLKSTVESWSLMKCTMESSLRAILPDDCTSIILSEWRLAAECMYRYLIGIVKRGIVGDDYTDSFDTIVITDSRCNDHRTSNQCLERRVRLPAALKAAKLAGAKESGLIRLVPNVSENYITYVEQKLLDKAHTSSYLKRMKSRCAVAPNKDQVLILTDDSDGNGGDDTRGSQGTWDAAVCGVAAAVSAVDMVVRGVCVNAFCVTRPPGHHAGRSLHPMKAVSNGFCILNPVACTAIHAVTPLSEGGLGLSRVCVIDFDVHHGNGTQDILCSTYDPRFLYVSLHAGGALINGEPTSDDPSDEPFGLTKNPKSSGIYPGRCGDTSPHKGVLNIPLGAKVTPHAVGTALLQRVTPAVVSFSPDLILLSAGFDAHKNDPMGLGGLSAEDFGNITDVACQLSLKTCSGRVVSILEGGYGVPCCRPQKNTFLPSAPDSDSPSIANTNASPDTSQQDVNKESDTSGQGVQKVRPQPSRLLDLGENIPDEMDDQVPYPLQVRLEKCQSEGFVECVFEHVSSLARCAKR